MKSCSCFKTKLVLVGLAGIPHLILRKVKFLTILTLFLAHSNYLLAMDQDFLSVGISNSSYVTVTQTIV